MLLVAIAAAVSLLCALASTRRLVFAVAPTKLDPKMLADAVKGAPFDAVTRAVERVPDATWEKNLLGAMKLPVHERAAEINEQLSEIDWLSERWARVPRVCASVSTSVGFLLATLALRQGLLDPNPEGIDALIVRSINILAVGIAGAMFCAVVHFGAGKAARARLADVDALVERLEAIRS
jgi:hypothetical protein